MMFFKKVFCKKESILTITIIIIRKSIKIFLKKKKRSIFPAYTHPIQALMKTEETIKPQKNASI